MMGNFCFNGISKGTIFTDTLDDGSDNGSDFNVNYNSRHSDVSYFLDVRLI